MHKYARKEDVPSKTLFVITTDGMENASREYTYSGIKQMIHRKQLEYGWEFIFLGANIDAVSEAERLGIRAERAARFHNDDIGIETNYMVLDEAVTEIRKCGSIRDTIMDGIRADFEERGGK